MLSYMSFKSYVTEFRQMIGYYYTLADICEMFRVTSLTDLLFMQTLITLQTIQNYSDIRNRKD